MKMKYLSKRIKGFPKSQGRKWGTSLHILETNQIEHNRWEGRNSRNQDQDQDCEHCLGFIPEVREPPGNLGILCTFRGCRESIVLYQAVQRPPGGHFLCLYGRSMCPGSIRTQIRTQYNEPWFCTEVSNRELRLFLLLLLFFFLVKDISKLCNLHWSYRNHNPPAYSSTHPPIHSFFHPQIHPVSQSCMHPSILSFIHPSTHLSTHSTFLCMHLSTHPSVHTPTHSFFHSQTYPTIHPFFHLHKH